MLFMLAVVLFPSCERNTESASAGRSAAEANNKPRKYFSGKPDLPEGPYEITSAGIGKVLLGDSLGKLCTEFDCSTAQDILILEEGKEWPAKKVALDAHTYVLAGMVNTVGLISKLATNSPDYKTRQGIHAGFPIDSLSAVSDSIIADPEHRAFTYGSTGIWFRIDPKREATFFKQKNPDIKMLKGGKIEEIFIICADC